MSNQSSRVSQLPTAVWQKIHDEMLCPRDRAALRLVQSVHLVRTTVDEQLHSLFEQLMKVWKGVHRYARKIHVPGTDATFDPFAYASRTNDATGYIIVMTLREIPSLACARAFIDLCEQLARLCGRDTVQATFYFSDDDEEERLRQAGVGILCGPGICFQGHSKDLCLNEVPFRPLKSWKEIGKFAKEPRIQYLCGHDYHPFRITQKLYDHVRSPLILPKLPDRTPPLILREGNLDPVNVRVYFGDRLKDSDYELFSTSEEPVTWPSCDDAGLSKRINHRNKRS